MRVSNPRSQRQARAHGNTLVYERLDEQWGTKSATVTFVYKVQLLYNDVVTRTLATRSCLLLGCVCEGRSS